MFEGGEQLQSCLCLEVGKGLFEKASWATDPGRPVEFDDVAHDDVERCYRALDGEAEMRIVVRQEPQVTRGAPGIWVCDEVKGRERHVGGHPAHRLLLARGVGRRRDRAAARDAGIVRGYEGEEWFEFRTATHAAVFPMALMRATTVSVSVTQQ